MIKSVKHTITITNGLSSLQVVGQDCFGNPIQDGLLCVILGTKCSTIEPSGFISCENLYGLRTGKKFKEVGEYAFYKCSNLRRANILNSDGSVQVDKIDDYAFSGCDKLKDITINLTESIDGSSLGDYCFSDCNKLNDFTWYGEPYFSPHMFYNDNFEDFDLPNGSHFIYPYCFSDLPNLTKVSIPSDFRMISEGMFANCTSLVDIDIEDTSISCSKMNTVGRNAFYNCPSLTQISFPRSISSIDYLDPLFLRGSSISSITFNGFSDDYLHGLGLVGQSDKWIESDGYVKTKSGFEEIATRAIEKSIPLILITGPNSIYIGVKEYDYENKIMKWMLNSEHWKEYINNNKERYIFVYGGQTSDQELFLYLNNPLNLVSSGNPIRNYSIYETDNTKSQIHIVWVKNGKLNVSTSLTSWVNTGNQDQGNYSADNTINEIESLISSSNVTYTIDNLIAETNGNLGNFGADRKITIISNSGKSYVLTNGKTSNVYQKTRPIKFVSSNFKYGTWYYDVYDMLSSNDLSGIPKIIVYGDRGLNSWNVFKNTIINNEEFINWVNQSPYLFGIVDITKNTNVHDASKTQENYIYNYVTNLSSYNEEINPIILFSWNGEHKIYSYDFEFSDEIQDPPYSAKDIMDLADEMFSSYNKDENYEKQEIKDILSSDGSTVIGRYYSLIEDDTECSMFNYDNKTSISQINNIQSKYNIQGINKSTTILHLNESTSINDGTYQYYDLNNIKTETPDKNGCLIRVSDNKIVNLYEFSNDYGI